MAKLIVLDTGVLGLVTNPNSNTGTQECKAWLRHHVVRNNVIVVPEIADYEVRRELLRAGKTEGLRRLDAFNLASLYEPIATATMRLAAQLWADARARGKPTAGPESLDCDVILCAQALQLARQPRHAEDELVVTTTNPRHLQQF